MPPCRRVIPFSHHHTASVCLRVRERACPKSQSPHRTKKVSRFRINKNMFVVDSIPKLRLHTLADGDRDWQNNNNRVSSVTRPHQTHRDRFSSIWLTKKRVGEIHLDDLKCAAFPAVCVCNGTFPIRLAAFLSGSGSGGGAPARSFYRTRTHL